ncbi:EthD domain-containing protein [Pacificimonas sp. ICDLI1SI03]
MGGISRRNLNISLAGAAVAAAVDASPAPAKSRSRFKFTEFVRRAAGLSPSQFVTHWHETRAPLLRSLPGISGLVFNHTIAERSPDARYDAVIEMWFDDEAAYRRAFEAADPALLRALAEDVAQFIDPDPLAFSTTEMALIEPEPNSPAGTAKRIGLVGRHPGTSEAAFFRKWQHHGAEAARQPGLTEYRLNFRKGIRPPSNAFDGYAALWWSDWEAFEAARIAIRPQLGERLAFFDAHMLIYVEEQIVIAPAR